MRIGGSANTQEFGIECLADSEQIKTKSNHGVSVSAWRNLKSIAGLLDMAPGVGFPLKTRDQRIFWVIQHIYNQQMRMYTDRVHSVENRIVNIYQPYVKPIVRGKDKV